MIEECVGLKGEVTTGLSLGYMLYTYETGEVTVTKDSAYHIPFRSSHIVDKTHCYHTCLICSTMNDIYIKKLQKDFIDFIKSL
jgi:hypothetical protein